MTIVATPLNAVGAGEEHQLAVSRAAYATAGLSVGTLLFIALGFIVDSHEFEIVLEILGTFIMPCEAPGFLIGIVSLVRLVIYRLARIPLRGIRLTLAALLLLSLNLGFFTK